VLCEGNTKRNIMKLGMNVPIYIPMKLQKSVCSYLLLLCCYGGVRYTIGTQEEMYYTILSNHPEISYTLYNMYSASIIAYFPRPESLCFIMNRKIPDLESEEENMPK